MEANSYSTYSQDQCTSPTLSPLRYLKQKGFQQQFRKISYDLKTDRPNFCLNLSSSDYKVMRVYIDAISSTQIRLYYTKFTPRTKRGQICIIHGYGQSTDDYLAMAEHFARRGYVINMLDLRGFGYSGGSRVNEATTKVLTDIQTLLKNCCERDLSTFVIAHGLGAMFLHALLQQNSDLPISGVINITPLVNFVNSNRSFTIQRILLTLSQTIFSNLLVHNMVNPTALAKNPVAIKNKIESIFWESFITLHMADEYEQVGEKVRADAYKFTYPTLLCCGGLDEIQDLNELKKYYNLLSSQDKQLLVFRQGYHQLQNDYESEQLLKRIEDWMESRRGKIKWKQINSLQKRNVIRRSRFWLKLLVVIGFLISAIVLLKKLHRCISRLGKV